MNKETGSILYENTPTLQTARLTLRKFLPGDANALLELLADREVNTFLPWFPLQTLAEAEAFLQQRFLDHYGKPCAYRYAICLREEDKPIGYVWLSDGPSYDFGYALKKACWHRGIATEAAEAVIQRIRQAGYSYITATYDRNNPASGAVMKRLGMRYCYSYQEQWQPKDFPVVFRMYQLDFDGNHAWTYSEYWERYANHFVEEGMCCD